jgi:hypothetical protein
MTTVPPPIPPRAPAIAEKVTAARDVLAALEAKTPGLTLRNAEERPGAHADLKQHRVAVAAAAAELEAMRDAYDEAIESDRSAVASRSASIRAMDPADLIEGITREKCCDGCTADGGCLLLAGINRCAHPRKAGLPPEMTNDRDLRNLQAAASTELFRQDEVNFFSIGEDDDDADDLEDDEDGDAEDDATSDDLEEEPAA